MMARVTGRWMFAAQGYPTNMSQSGVGMIFTNKKIVDGDSHFWIIDKYQMTEIPEERSKNIRVYGAVKPEKWYFSRETAGDRYTKKIAHIKKGGFATALEHDMYNGHRKRIHVFPNQKLTDYLDSQLLVAEENWK